MMKQIVRASADADKNLKILTAYLSFEKYAPLSFLFWCFYKLRLSIYITLSYFENKKRIGFGQYLWAGLRN